MILWVRLCQLKAKTLLQGWLQRLIGSGTVARAMRVKANLAQLSRELEVSDSCMLRESEDTDHEARCKVEIAFTFSVVRSTFRARNDVDLPIQS